MFQFHKVFENRLSRKPLAPRGLREVRENTIMVVNASVAQVLPFRPRKRSLFKDDEFLVQVQKKRRLP